MKTVFILIYLFQVFSKDYMETELNHFFWNKHMFNSFVYTAFKDKEMSTSLKVDEGKNIIRERNFCKYLNLIRHHASLGNLENVEKLFKEGRYAFDSQVRLAHEVIRFYRDSGHYSKKQKLCQEIVTMYGKDYDSLYDREKYHFASILVEMRREEEGILKFEELFATLDKEDIYYGLTANQINWACNEIKDYDKAIYYGKIAVNTRNTINAYSNLAYAYRRKEDYKNECEILKEAVKQFPNEKKFAFSLIEAYEKMNAFEEALALQWNQAQKYPKNTRLWRDISRTASKVKDKEKEIYALEKLCALQPDVRSYFVRLMRRYKEQGNEKSLEGLLKACEKENGLESLRIYLLDYAMQYGDDKDKYDALEAWFQVCSNEKENFFDAAYLLYEDEFLMNKVFEVYGNQFGNEDLLSYQLFIYENFYRYHGYGKRILETAKLILEKSPQNKEAIRYMAKILEEQKEYEKAYDAYKNLEGVSEEEQAVETILSQIRVCIALQHLDEAKTLCEKYVKKIGEMTPTLALFRAEISAVEKNERAVLKYLEPYIHEEYFQRMVYQSDYLKDYLTHQKLKKYFQYENER